jgi:ketosteroid isomerase-like protein
MQSALSVLLLAAWFTMAPLSAHGQASTQSSQPSEEQRVLAAEDEYVAAEVSRDEEVLRRLVDDRFVFNTSDGTTWGKEQLIQSVLDMNMTGQTITERSVLIEDDIALVFGTAELRFGGADGEETVSTLRYTSTYVRRDAGWRMLALQMQKRRQP